MKCVKYSDSYVQNAYWEGFTKSDEATSLFVWNSSGELIQARTNYL